MKQKNKGMPVGRRFDLQSRLLGSIPSSSTWTNGSRGLVPYPSDMRVALSSILRATTESLITGDAGMFLPLRLKRNVIAI